MNDESQSRTSRGMFMHWWEGVAILVLAALALFASQAIFSAL